MCMTQISDLTIVCQIELRHLRTALQLGRAKRPRTDDVPKTPAKRRATASDEAVQGPSAGIGDMFGVFWLCVLCVAWLTRALVATMRLVRQAHAKLIAFFSFFAVMLHWYCATAVSVGRVTLPL